MEPIGDRPFYSAYAWAYDLLITRPVARDCMGIATLFAQRGVAPGARILDAGCGTGGYALALAQRGYVVTGLDLSMPLLAEAQKRSTASLACATPQRLSHGARHARIMTARRLRAAVVPLPGARMDRRRWCAAWMRRALSSTGGVGQATEYCHWSGPA
jgi:SAM-dependent methyltransferase